jgi:hypothetical protein
MRWTILLVVLGLAAPAGAQVFKPKPKAPAAQKRPARPAAKKHRPKKKSAPKKRAAPAASANDDRAAAGEDDPDFVKITDDDEIE